MGGLTDNATGPATDVYLNSYPGYPNIYGGNSIISGGIDMWGFEYYNSFTVANGVITDAQFLDYAGDRNTGNFSQFQLYPPGFYDYLYSRTNNITTVYVSDSIVPSIAVYKLVPFEFSPVQGFMLGIPLFIGLRYLKKKRA